jgi:hypothetical protein
MAGKRMNGEGSIYQRKSDGRWFGAVVVGTGRAEAQNRQRENEGGARQKLKRLMEEQERLQAERLPPIDNTATVSQVLDRWHKVIVATRRETHRHQLSICHRRAPRRVRSPGGQNAWFEKTGPTYF